MLVKFQNSGKHGLDRVWKPDACRDRMLVPQYPVYGILSGLILLPFKVHMVLRSFTASINPQDSSLY